MSNKERAKIGRPAVPFDDRIIKDELSGCWNWTGVIVRGGYGQYRHAGKMVYAHRFAYEREFGAIPGGLFVCHSCDNPKCCNPAHLFLGNHADNMRDKVSKDRQSRQQGALNPSAKLREKDVLEILEFRELGMPITRLAKAYGVTKQTISQICSGQKWAHIKRSNPT